MADPLEGYRRLRDFAATPEPAGQVSEAGTGSRFVVQEHHATALHWDLRLEHEGVLASWAVPKGIPPDPRQNHLAVRTEDHPLEYLDFSGTIPEGGYGAGMMVIWDEGTYETHKFTDREVQVTFAGRRTTGRYALFRTDGRNWMIHRMDPPADPERAPMPSDLRPMWAGPGPLPGEDEDGAWAYEVLWPGMRIVVSSEGGRARLDRDGVDLSGRFPEVRVIGAALGTTEVVVDGVLTGDDVDALRRRSVPPPASASAVRRLAGLHPARLMAFDLLWLEGHPTMELPYADRRRLLADLNLAGPAWAVPGHHVGDGAALLATAAQQGLTGIVAKRLDGRYRPGERSPDWRVVSTA